MTLVESWLWPKVDIRRNAQNAIDEAFWVSVVLSAYTAVFAALFLAGSEPDTDASGFVGAAVLAAIAFGIRRRSRIAAIAGLALFVSDRIYFWVAVRPTNPILPVLIALAFLHGVRGTLAYHKFPPLPANLPSIAQSFQAVSSAPREGGEDRKPS